MLPLLMQQLHPLQVLRQRLPGSMLTRSLNPFPSLTVTWFCSKSTSFTRNRTHSINRSFKAHHLADLLQQLELRIRNEPLSRPRRLASSNI
jgi:hypothetical protein